MLMDKKILLFLALSAAGYPLCSQAQSQFKLQTQEIKNADNEPAPVFPVPSDRQLKWNETEFYAFYHYGMIGRCDLPGGNEAQLIRVFKEKILSLPSDVNVLPGHGVATTIGEEKRANRYLL